MSTNITLSVTAEGEDVGMAVAIMARTVSELIRGTENLQSINLAVFTDEYVADELDEDAQGFEVAGDLPPVAGGGS